MKKIILTIASVAALSTTFFAQETARVLFIGNSYTSANNLPSMINSIAVSQGDQFTYDTQIPGGTTLQGHTQNAATWTKIKGNTWDYVVVQAQSQEPSFPDAQVNNNTIPYAIQLADSVYANNFCTEVMMYMTWGRKDGDPQWAPISSFNGMNNRLRSAYLRMADSVQGSVSPVGSAWRYVRETYPSIELYSGDGSHPSVAGTYLAACTFYASVFRKTPVGSSFISALDATTAAELQSAAALTVLDSLETFNLRPVSEHTQANFSYTVNDPEVVFTNESTKALTYNWSFDDGQVSSDKDPIHSYSSNGVFTVQLIAESPCDSDTTTYEISINLSSLEDEKEESVKVRTVAPGVYHVVYKEAIEDAEVFSIDGKRILVQFVTSNEIKVDLSQERRGQYLLRLKDGNEVKSIRLMY